MRFEAAWTQVRPVDNRLHSLPDSAEAQPLSQGCACVPAAARSPGREGAGRPSVSGRILGKRSDVTGGLPPRSAVLPNRLHPFLPFSNMVFTSTSHQILLSSTSPNPTTQTFAIYRLACQGTALAAASVGRFSLREGRTSLLLRG